MVVVWCQDIMFRSKIREASGGVGVTFAMNEGDVLQALGAGGVDRVIVDKDVRTPDLNRALADIAARKGATKLLLFGSHKDREGLQAALDAGCDEVMPRSKFVALLPSLVS